MTKPAIAIYHNPNCGTSRNTLEIIRQAGHEPQVVEYLKTPPSKAELKSLLQEAGLTAWEALRKKGDVFEQLNIHEGSHTEAALLALMVEHPVLIERPIVKTKKGVRLCRPKEKVLEILP